MDDRLWYKDAIFYELHVRAFQDGNQDGIGDFAGLTQRLDYLADLGITAIWLLPFTRSPLKDDGYDIADYRSVHPNYGTIDDFRVFLNQAHAAGIKVITELVINHTSDQHPWFQRARRAPAGSREREFYVWSDDPDRYQGVPLMFPDFETSNWTWDPIARQYYWHRFYSHQPDLNFDNPAVRDAILPVVDFWFEMGVDGMRLDAVPYLIEREGTACEHLPETHAFLQELRSHVDQKFTGKMFLAEANAWPDDMVSYFGKGDECHMAFHFPLMPRLFMALHQENRFPIVDILTQMPAIPDDCQWCLFLRNHDELTLAMVTDEERDAMYTAYARDRQARLFLGIRHRLAPLMSNDRRRIELMNAILFSLPGTPVIYYGDEIGMGDNIYLGDRNGVRTPMQWSEDRNAGFSRANSQKLFLPVIVDSEYHYEAINVESQQNNHSSLLWWMKRLIDMRKKHIAFGRGDLRLLEASNSKVLAYVRQCDSESLLIVANLSRFVQNVQIDLGPYAGLIPEEMFGRTRFPPIRENEPYGLTLGPHGFYWFLLQPSRVTQHAPAEIPRLFADKWPQLLRGRGWEQLSQLILAHQSTPPLTQVISCQLVDQKQFQVANLEIMLVVCRVEFEADAAETIFQFLSLIDADRLTGAAVIPRKFILARTGKNDESVICDPMGLPEYQSAIVEMFAAQKPISLSGRAELHGTVWTGFENALENSRPASIAPAITQEHRTSTSALTSDVLIRSYRRPDEGANLDVEIGKYLQESGFAGFADILGTLDYRRSTGEVVTLAALHRAINSQGNAWTLMQDQAGHFFEKAATLINTTLKDFDPSNTTNARDAARNEHWETLLSQFLDTPRRLGEFVADLHSYLANAPATTQYATIPANQRAFYQTLRNRLGKLHSLLLMRHADWPDEVQEMGSKLVKRLDSILNFIREALRPELAHGLRIQCHGDLRLGKLLVAGQNFVLTDFEGQRDRPVGERRIKKSPFHDVATLLGSLDYAVNSYRLGLSDKVGSTLGHVREEDRNALAPFAAAWLIRMKKDLTRAYLQSLRPQNLLPQSDDARKMWLELSAMEEAFRDAVYDLKERPTWATVPLATILRLTES